MRAVALLEHPDGRVTLDKARHIACMQAMWEVSALAQVLGDQASHATRADADGQFPFAARGLAARLLDLSKVCTVALTDPVPDVVAMAQELHLVSVAEGQP